MCVAFQEILLSSSPEQIEIKLLLREMSLSDLLETQINDVDVAGAGGLHRSIQGVLGTTLLPSDVPD
jgi:hypothetical protein